MAHANPLFHTVEVIRHAAFGVHLAADAAHLAYLIGFAIAAWLTAAWRMRLSLVA